jgi:dimethylglycine dehydrogenase
LKTHTQVVVIGGGVVGCSILYHLTKLGWSDVVLLERKELTAGSTWHAAGGFHTLNGDPNVARLQKYTIDLYHEIEKITGDPVGIHLTGGISLAATDAWWEMLKNEAARHKVMGIDSELISPSEIKAHCPVVDISDFKGGLFMADEGHIDPYSITHGYAKAAKMQGAEIYRQTKVNGLNPRKDGSWDVITNQGNIRAEHVVNAGGLWAREVGEMVGIDLPLLPFEHHYLITDEIPCLKDRDKEIVTVVDLDGEIYLRQEQDGVLLGVYETPATPWSLDGTSWDYGETDLLPNNLERLYGALEKGFERFPEVAEAGIKRVVNGPFTFSPDGNPLVGPIDGLSNYWVACGVMAGFAQGGGIGLTLAQWMIEGQPEGDVFGMDIARFGTYADKDYTVARASEFYERRMRMRYPNEFWPAARPKRTTQLYETHKKDNAVFGVSDGLEIPMYFAAAAEEAIETPSFHRSNAFPTVGEECRAVRESAGILDISAYGKYEISGADAEDWLNRIVACKLPVKGRIRLAPLLGDNGRLMGDLTVWRVADDRFMLFGSGYLQRFHMRWFHDHLNKERVKIIDHNESLAGLSVSGPNARELLQSLCDVSLENEDFSFLSTQQIRIGNCKATVGRVSLTGEIGYEIYLQPQDHLTVYSQLMEAAKEKSLQLRPYGVYALLSLRMEKSYGIWSREFSPDYTPKMCGLDSFVDYDKADFIGREASLRGREISPTQKLVTFELDTEKTEVGGYEPVWFGEQLAGFTTSGGYGHTVTKSLAMGYIQAEFVNDNRDFEISILGERRQALMLDRPVYDPEGKKLR